MTASAKKPVIVYLHRYAPEVEAIQWPALTELADVLSADYELVYICMASDKVRDAGIRRHIRVIELPFSVAQSDGRDKWCKTFRWYMNLRRILNLIRNEKPALIICKETLPFIPGRMVKTGIPVIIETSDWWWSILFGHTAFGRKLAGWLERSEVKKWNRAGVTATVSTNAEGRLLNQKGMDVSRIAVINAPQDPGVFHPLIPRTEKTELGLDADRHYFAIFGIIRGGKGYDQLLDWWKAVAEKHPDWTLVIIGGAGGERWCRNEIARRNLECATHMTGWLPSKHDVNRWLSAMDAIIVQRRNSPDNQGIIPSALFNGLSTGRPVVASGLAGIAEVMRDGIDGFLFKPDCELSFINALEKAVADSVTAENAGLSGMTRAAECFNPRNAAELHRKLIDSMISGITG